MKFDLVFEGGGAKGIVFVGALNAFLSRGHTYDRLLGTSAGAISSTLLAAGYTVDEMQATLTEKIDGKSVFTEFMGTPSGFDDALIRAGTIYYLLSQFNSRLIPDDLEVKLRERLLEHLAARPPGSNLFSLVELGGWYSADKFRSWLERKLNEGEFRGQKRNFGNMTLKEFHEVTGTDLSLVATDTTEHLMLVLNHRTAPDLPVVWGARMSMSIPLLWQEVVWQREWGTYAGSDVTDHILVDGGVLSNFPIELFLSADKDVTDVMGPKTSENVLGLLIDEQLEVPGATAKVSVNQGGVDFAELKIVQRMSGLVSTVLEAHDKAVIDAFEDSVLRLPAKGYGTTEFDMTDERRELLMAAGHAAMTFYLDRMEPVLAKAASKAPEMAVFGMPGEEAAPAVNPQADKIAGRMLRRGRLITK